MDALNFEEMPDMRHPYLLLTYDGWSNAAGVATATGQILIDHLEAKRFASIDPEEFYSFAEQRPQARYNQAGQREIIWPQNDFYFCSQPQLEHDIIIAVGVEPHLKWRTYINLMIDVVKTCQVYQTVTLGALWADVLHTAPVRFTGSSTDSSLAERFGLNRGSRYEGPTGMVGILHDMLRRSDLPSASIWANMSYYLANITSIPNPKGILALSQCAMELVGLPADFPELEKEADRFKSRVDAAIEKEPKVQALVRDLERRTAREQRSETSTEQERRAVSGEDLAAEFERFLREQRDNPEAT